MPKFIGQTIEGSRPLPFRYGSPNMVFFFVLRLSYGQAKLLDPADVFFQLDETDVVAKRWNRWFATPRSVLQCARSTSKMRAAALASVPCCHENCAMYPFTLGAECRSVGGLAISST